MILSGVTSNYAVQLCNFPPHNAKAYQQAWTRMRLRCAVVACRPYDTLEEVIGLRGTPGHGSLAEWGVHYDELPRPATGGAIDFAALPAAITAGVQHRREQNIPGTFHSQIASSASLQYGELPRPAILR